MSKLKTIKIFGKPFAVSFANDHFDAATLGVCEPLKNTITILQDQPPAEELDTVVHEVMHAVAHVMSIPFPNPETEEQVVRMLGTGFTGVLLDNPEFLDYINEITQKVAPNASRKKT